jgi:hypothetical protein
LAAGSGICAPAIVTTGSVAQNPSPIARIVRSFVMCFTVGVRRL